MRRAMPPLSSFARGLVSLLIAGVLLGSLPTGFASARPIVQDAASLVAPALSKPADATTTDDTTPTFKWSAVKGAEAYRFELALDPSFTALVNTIEDRRRTYTLRTNLEPGLTYFWRAGSVDQLGGISWSETRTLTIAGAAQEPPAATATVPTSTPSPAATATPTSLPRVRATSTPDPIVIAAAVPVSQVSGTMQPSTGIRISGAGRSRGSTTSTSVVDRNLGTLWFSAGGTPTEAFVYIKLDRTRKVGTIRWMMGYSGYADRYEIQISKDRKTWTTIGKRTNSAAGTWREITVNRDARYVRFYFRNPKRDPMLGGLAEVEVMAATTAAVATSTATSSATPVSPATSTPVPTATDTPVPTATKTATPAKTPTATKTSTPTKTAPPASSATPTPSATATATIAGNLLSNTITTTTPTPPATATVTPTTMPTPTASPTATATPTIVPTLTATPSPTATSTPSPTATPVPTATATPAPTVLPISGGLIVNPSFEQGEAGWHLEGQSGVTDQGAIGGSRALRIESGGGLADQHLTLLPGNTYELSVWGRTDGGVDLGEVGVIYRDASWRRLQGLEPADITFTSTTYQKKTLVFTVPQSVAHVTVYVWKEAGPAGLLVDDLYLVKALSALPSPTVTTPTLSCQQLIAPAYFYPTTGYWQTMIADSSALGIIVLNPNSGVGAKHEWRYDAPLAQARAAGIRIIGYIQTDYGTRAVSEILTEMDRYREWYGVTSYFLDEGDTDIASIGLYTEMTAYAHAMGGITVINFGYHPHPAYMDITDHAIVFEDAMNVFLAYSPPSWIKDYPADRFMNLIYGVPEDQVDEIIQITRERNLGTVWITDDHINTGSPYNTLPTYWSSLNQTLAAGCSGS